MKKVTGYLTHDRVFFELQRDAKMHEHGLEMMRRDKVCDETSNGILYETFLSGSGGIVVELYPSAEHTKNDIIFAKDELRKSRDVLHFNVITPCLQKP